MRFVNYLKKSFRRILMSLCGVIICAISVGGFKHAALGVDPFQSLMSGLDFIVPDSLMSFGTLYMVVNAALLCFSLIFDRRNIGLATFINLFLLGYITDFTQKMLETWVPNPVLWVRWVFLIVAIVVICFGSALYMTASLGVSTYDAVAITLSGKWKLGKFKYVRIACDLVCVLIGCILFLLASMDLKQISDLSSLWAQMKPHLLKITEIAGVGTIITAFFMGPLIDFFNRKVAIPLLNKKK